MFVLWGLNLWQWCISMSFSFSWLRKLPVQYWCHHWPAESVSIPNQADWNGIRTDRTAHWLSGIHTCCIYTCTGTSEYKFSKFLQFVICRILCLLSRGLEVGASYRYHGNRHLTMMDFSSRGVWVTIIRTTMGEIPGQLYRVSRSMLEVCSERIGCPKLFVLLASKWGEGQAN